MIGEVQRLWIPGALPGMNEIIKASKGSFGKGRTYAAMKRKITSWMSLLIKASLRPVQACSVHFTWHERAMRRDPDNVTAGQKFVFDALVESGVLIGGDGWAGVKGISHDWTTSEKPGVWIFIEERESK